MFILETVASMAFFAWALFSFWIVFRILKLCWPVLKNDWFWFATKSGYYKGFLLGIGWYFIAMAPCALFGQAWLLLPMVIQLGVAIKWTRDKSLPKLDKAVWFAIPFFMLPLWLTVKQGQSLGELPVQPNPPLNSDPTCTA